MSRRAEQLYARAAAGLVEPTCCPEGPYAVVLNGWILLIDFIYYYDPFRTARAGMGGSSLEDSVNMCEVANGNVVLCRGNS